MCLAIPGKIIELLGDNPPLAAVEVAGVRCKVDLGLLQDDMPVLGDWVLIHVGFAMSKVSEQDALDQMRMLMMLGEQEQAMEEIQGYGLDEGEEQQDSLRGDAARSRLPS
ncbi:MAG TPA: HypC/HybG/HupF family hydrogenase formation chaperone [Candidatus Angelobacter sp.]|nr:HypC/HybG/HupF family hydrogenase formation chaperone [Candidatus Angelobacter sp.]